MNVCGSESVESQLFDYSTGSTSASEYTSPATILAESGQLFPSLIDDDRISPELNPDMRLQECTSISSQGKRLLFHFS